MVNTVVNMSPFFWGYMLQKGQGSSNQKLTLISLLLFTFFSLTSPTDPQDENKIGIDGIQQFCDDLTLDPASMSILVVAWKFRAATQCEFSRKEFLDGMSDLG